MDVHSLWIPSIPAIPELPIMRSALSVDSPKAEYNPFTSSPPQVAESVQDQFRLALLLELVSRERALCECKCSTKSDYCTSNVIPTLFRTPLIISALTRSLASASCTLPGSYNPSARCCDVSAAERSSPISPSENKEDALDDVTVSGKGTNWK